MKAPPAKRFFRLWIAVTACWLVYMIVVSSVGPFGFGLPEFLLAI